MVDNKPPEQNSRDEVVGRFLPYVCTQESLEGVDEIREIYANLADKLWHLLPGGREKSVALTDLESSLNWALQSHLRNNQDPAAGPAK